MTGISSWGCRCPCQAAASVRTLGPPSGRCLHRNPAPPPSEPCSSSVRALLPPSDWGLRQNPAPPPSESCSSSVRTLLPPSGSLSTCHYGSDSNVPFEQATPTRPTTWNVWTVPQCLNEGTEPAAMKPQVSDGFIA